MTQQHPVEWNDEKVARFWDFYSGRLQDIYFARAAGGYLVALLQRHVRLKGARLLDYGCGQGFLFEHLERRRTGARWVGLDFSPGSVEQCRARFAGRAGFGQAVHAGSLPSSLAAGSADVAVSLEMIEHLDDTRLVEAIDEMKRVLRPGGTICVTTPNQEDMNEQSVMCPDCGCVFHRWQHVRSWSPQTLTAFMRERGFIERCVLEADLAPWHARLKRAVKRRLRGGRPMNLVYIGTKPT